MNHNMKNNIHNNNLLLHPIKLYELQRFCKNTDYLIGLECQESLLGFELWRRSGGRGGGGGGEVRDGNWRDPGLKG